MIEEKPAIVIENGSMNYSVGYSGEDLPRIIAPNIVSLRKDDPASTCLFATIPRLGDQSILSELPKPLFCDIISAVYQRQQKEYFGEEAQLLQQENSPLYSCICPVSRGVVVSELHMERILHHIFYHDMKVDPTNHCVLLSQKPRTPKVVKENITQLMFEKFDCAGFNLCYDAVLSIYSHGLTTAFMIDIGADGTNFVPVYDGTILHCTELNIGGRTLTNYLAKLLDNEWPCTEIKQNAIVSEIKEKLCYVSDVPLGSSPVHISKKLGPDEYYVLPDGKHIVLDTEPRVCCPEALFQPSVIGLEEPGLPQKMADTIYKCDPSIRRDLLRNVLISGGTSFLVGLKERLFSELSSLLPHRLIRMPIICERHSAWIGGSILSSLTAFTPMWAYREDYNEYGPGFIHRKCDI